MGVKSSVTIETLLLTFFLVVNHSVSSSRLCLITGSSVTIRKIQHLFVRTDEKIVSFGVRNPDCNVQFDVTYVIAKGDSNVCDDSGRVWHEIKLSVERKKFYVDFKSSAPYSQYKKSFKYPSWVCIEGRSLNVTFKDSVDLAKECNGTNATSSSNSTGSNSLNKVACENNSELNVETTTTAYRSRGHVKHKYSNTSYSRSSYYYTPLGIISLVLILGLRYCIWQACQKPSVVERVRTVTVVRQIHVSSSSSSTSSSSANEPTLADPTDLPPSYADIENENPPPAYSELEHIKIPTDAYELLSEEEEEEEDEEEDSPITGTSASSSSEATTGADGGTATETENSELSETGNRSALSRVLAVGSRSLRKQFAFKPMKEEEE